jgi:hypothetical protein
MDSKSTKIII